MKKRILSILITLVMLIGLVSVMSIGASAAAGYLRNGELHYDVVYTDGIEAGDILIPGTQLRGRQGVMEINTRTGPSTGTAMITILAYNDKWPKSSSEYYNSAFYVDSVTDHKIFLIPIETAVVTFDLNDGNGTYMYINWYTKVPLQHDMAFASVPEPTRTGYTFVGWNTEADGTGTEFISTSIEDFSVTGNTTLYAQWKPNKYTVTFKNEDGSTLQSGNWDYDTTPSYTGATPTKAATAQYTYAFKGWDSAISTVTGEKTYTATYTATINSYAVNVSANPTEGGTVNGGGTYEYGTDVTVTATANNGYTLVNWTKNGSVVSTNATYTFTATENCELVATFERAYGVWVGDEQFTENRLTINGNTGSATYDPATKTLTLNNFSYTGEGYNYSGNVGALIYSTGIDLKIVLKGTNTFAEIDGYQEGIIIKNGSLTIANSDADDVMGSLQLTAGYPVIGVNNGSLFVENVNLTVINTASPTANPGIAILVTGDISITNSDVTAISGDSNGDNIPESGATAGLGAMGSISVTNSIVSATGDYGGMLANRLSVTNSIVTAAGNFGALIAADSSLVPTLNGEFTVTAGNDAASATAADATLEATYANKYVKIEPKIHTHCICGETHASVGNHDAEVSTTFTAVTNQAELQNAATNGGNVYLANDIVLTADIIVAGNLNLCLNGYSITPADSLTDGRAITVNIGATFVLTDCGDGCISGFMTSTHINGVGVYNEGTFTMYAGTISDIISNGHGGGVYNKGTFTMYGGTIRNNEMITGGWYGGGAGVHQRAGSFTMYGGTITGNKTVGTGGGVYYLGGTFTMHGGTITDNEAEGSGGGVYHNGGTFTMYGGTIGENCANSGGGVYGNYFAMHGGSVINNTATTYGGGIYSYNGTLELSGSVTITGNEVNEEQSDIYIGYTVITIKDDFTPTSAIGVTKHEVVGTIVRAADGETLDIEDYKQYFVGEEGIPFYVAGDALELGYTITEEPDDTNNHTVKTNGDANASYQWAKYGLIAHPVVYESSYGPMSLRSVTPMPGMKDAFGIEAALVDACGYWDTNTWVYYANYDAENKYWIASNNVLFYDDANDCSHEFDASYFIIIPEKNGTLSVTLIDPLDNGEELALYIVTGEEGYDWLAEEVTPNADGSYSLTAGIPYRLLIKDSDDTNNGTYEYGFNETFPKLTATFTAMGASELLDGQNEATLDITGLGSGAYICKTAWDIYDTPADAEDDYYLVSAPVTRYGVIFDYGTLGSETKTVSSGETVTPPAPVFAGKVLVGWYTDSNFTTEFDFSDAITADNTTIYAKFADYEGDKAELNDAIDALETAVDNVKTALDNKVSTDKLTEEIGKLNQAIAGAKTYADTQDAALKTTLEAADTTMNAAITELQNRVTALETGLTTANGKISINTADVGTLKTDLSILNAWKTEAQNAIIALQNLTNTQNTNISKLQTAVADLDNALTKANGKIAEVEDRIAALEGRVSALEKAEQELEAAVAALNAAIANKADTVTLNQKVGELNEAITKAEATAKEYTDGVVRNLRVAIIAAKDEAVDAAKDLVDAAKEELQAAIDNKADTTVVNTKIANLQNAITALQNAKDNYIAADTALKAELEDAIAKAKQEAIDAAKGYIPYIGTNGNWWIGATDTCVDANGIKGDKGDTGAQGADGVGIAKIEKTSSDGNVDTYTITMTDGTTYTFTVTNGTNGTDGKDGKDGTNGKDGVDGKDGTNGTNGVDGKDGANGEDGQTPYIGENGNWWIGDTDTGVKAAGDDGKDGAIIAATAVGGTALISNIALIAWTLIKKKRLF